MRFIVIPQAIKIILPTLGNEFVTLIKETTVLSIKKKIMPMLRFKVVKKTFKRKAIPVVTAFNSTFFLDSLICNKNDAKYNGGAISIIW